ncbi:putative Membrane protein [Pseudomonas amygdali pv. mori]|uniref:Putative Membrane protein n=2 Tax=Pseudomonas amygdali TaxID=47877 RepID=A0A3M5INC4_PSEA0|nr:putative Membrane protein [Pseudomonas amygdali pv. mori]
MNYIKPFFLFIALLLTSNFAFADDFKDCYRPDSHKTLNECMDHAVANAPYIGPLLNTLETDRSLLVVNYAGNKLTNFNSDSKFTLTHDSTESDYLSQSRDKLVWAGGVGFLYFYTAFACYLIFRGQATSFIGKDRKDVVYFAIISAGIMILLGFGVLFDLYAGSILTGVVVGISFVVNMSLKLWTYTQLDVRFNTTQANALARNESTPIIMAMIQQHAANILFNSKQFNTFNYETNEKGERVYKETAYSTCMNESAEPSRVLTNLLVDGEAQKTQKCLKQVGFDTFNLGHVSYFGADESTKSALIEMNDLAQMVALDSIKFMCGNALNVEDRRVQWAPHLMVYDQCLNRIASGGVENGADGKIQFFPQNDGITKASIQAQIEQMRQVYVASAGVFVQTHAQVAKDAVQRPLADIASFMLDISTVNRVAGDLEYQIEKEYKENVQAVYDPVILGFKSQSALTQNTDLDNRRKVSESLQTESVFDIDKTISILVLPTSSEAWKAGLKNTMEYTANGMFGNLYTTSGFTFEDCTKEVNTCIAPALNQSAALFSNGMSALKNYWTMYIVFKTGQLTLDEFESPSMKKMARVLGFFVSMTAFAISFLTGALVLSGLLAPLFFLGRFAQGIFSLPSSLIVIYIKIASLIFPHGKNHDQEKSFHVFLDLILSLLWKMLEPLIILVLFTFTIALQGILVVFVSNCTYFIVMPLVQTGGLVENAIAILFMLLVFAMLNVYVGFKLCVSMMRILDSIQRIFKAESVSDLVGEAQEKYEEIQSKVKEVTSKLAR